MAETRTPLLAVDSLRSGYGRVEVLHGVSLAVAARRDRDHRGRQRRGEVDAAQDARGASEARLAEPSATAAATSAADAPSSSYARGWRSCPRAGCSSVR